MGRFASYRLLVIIFLWLGINELVVELCEPVDHLIFPRVMAGDLYKSLSWKFLLSHFGVSQLLLFYVGLGALANAIVKRVITFLIACLGGELPGKILEHICWSP